MIRLLEKDRLNAGRPQLVLENDLLSVILIPELGGRVLDVRNLALDPPRSKSLEEGATSVELTYLHRVFPEAVQFGPYTEYGGIEECVGSAPGQLWHIPWRVEKRTDGVLLSAVSSTPSSRVLVQKQLGLHPTEPILQIEYSFVNIEPRFTRFTFGVHLEVGFGVDDDRLAESQYSVPAEDGLVQGRFATLGEKQFITPDEGWCMLWHGSRVLAILFPERVVDAVEVYYPRVGTHLVMQPMLYGIGLSPNRRAFFSYWLYFGEGDWESIRSLRQRIDGSLRAGYEPVAPMRESEPGRRAHPFMQQPLPALLPGDQTAPLQQPPERSEAETPERTVMPVPAAPEFQQQRSQLQVMKRHFQIPGRTCGRVEVDQDRGVLRLTPSTDGRIHITCRGLAQPDQNAEAWKPGVTLSQQVLSIRVYTCSESGVALAEQVRCEIAVPPELADLRLWGEELDLRMGGLSPLKLRVRNERGNTRLQVCPRTGAHIHLSSVSGDTTVWLAENAQAQIEASSVTGRVACQLDLLDAEHSVHHVRGVSGAPAAELYIDSVNGQIVLLSQSSRRKKCEGSYRFFR